MKPRFKRQSRLEAFTLIEMLVVIAIIGILAALILPISGAINKRGTIAKAQGQMAELETAINAYKQRLNFYPPDNPGNPLVHQLYFELIGTTLSNNVYRTLDNSGLIPVNRFLASFGPGVKGFVNTAASRSSDEGHVVKNFLPGTKSSQRGALMYNSAGSEVVWAFVGPTPGTIPTINKFNNAPMNTWRYVSTNPTNNPAAYDLWLDVILGGKTNRISNWSKQPQIVY